MSAPTEALSGSATIVVAAPPEKAYALVSDVTRLPELSPECDRCHWQEGPTAEVGASFVGHNRAHGQEWSTLCEVIAADAPKRFAFETGTPERRFTRWCYEFAPDGAFGTRVSESFEILELPPHLAGASVDEQEARIGELEDGVRQTLVRLKQVLERRTAEAGAVVGPEDGRAFRLGDALMTIKTLASDSGVAVVEWVSPPGGTAPLHVHHDLDDNFYLLDGELILWCDGRTFRAGAGDFVVLPAGVPHSIFVEGGRPIRALLVHANDQFLDFVQEAGAPADGPTERSSFDPQAMADTARRHGQEILGPSPFVTATGRVP
jgi:mannose-6-phosphate isomerase-like protein (cupin superfamily)